MSQCKYCDRRYETDEALVEHMAKFHDREELSAVDRRWIDRYAETTTGGEPNANTPSDPSGDSTLNRRQLVALAGASTVGIAGMTVGLAEQNSLSAGDLPGLGTQNSPNQIATFSELLAIDNDLTADYVLVDDIDATGESPIDPLGSSFPGFTGTLDGQGHEIVGLEIDGVGSYGSAGLFGWISSGATIDSLHLVDVTVTGENKVGGFVAQMNGGTIRNCSVTGDVVATDIPTAEAGPGNAGGIAGRQGNSDTIRECGTNVTVDSDGRNAGGLVGSKFGTIVDSYALGPVQAASENRVGGVFGQDCSNCSNQPVDRTYAAGDVSGNQDVGGLTGLLEVAALSDSYWDELATTQTAGVGTNSGGTINNIQGFDTNDSTGRADEMTGADAANNMTAFDFNGTWQTVEAGVPLGSVAPTEDGYPILSSMDTRRQLEAQGVAFEEGGTGTRIEGSNATLDNVTVKGDGN